MPYSGTNIPAQMIARATGVTGNQLLPDTFADKFGILPTPDQSEQRDPAQLFVQILQQTTGGFMPSESDGGFIIDWFPTETIRPTESGDDGGFVIYGFPTETIRPMESIHPFEVLI